MPNRLFLLAALLLLAPLARAAEADIVVYGGTAAGVMASIQAAKMGKTVILVEPSAHIGGLTSGGLGYTDSGDKRGVGGLSLEFYRRVKKHYDRPEAWKFGKREDYKNYRPADDAMWTFEPHVAEQILREMLVEHKVDVVTAQLTGMVHDDKRILWIAAGGKTYAAAVFIDATYEGDLMRFASVTYAIGREPNAKYGETLNGVQKAKNTHNHRFTVKVGEPKDAEAAKAGTKLAGQTFVASFLVYRSRATTSKLKERRGASGSG